MKYIIMLLMCTLLLGCSTLSRKDTHSMIKGFNYNKSGEYTKALGEFKRIYDKNKKNEILLNEMAYSYTKLGDFEEAKKYYNQVIEVNPENEKALLNLAIIKYREDKKDESAELLKKIPKDSLTNQVYAILSYIQYDKENYEKAYPLMIKTIKYGGGKDYIFINKYIKVLQKLKKDDEIFPYLYDVYEKPKKYLLSKSALEYSSLILENFDDKEKAFQILNDSLLYKQTDEVALELAKLKISQKDYKGAEGYLNLLSEKYRYDKEVLELRKILDKVKN